MIDIFMKALKQGYYDVSLSFVKDSGFFKHRHEPFELYTKQLNKMEDFETLVVIKESRIVSAFYSGNYFLSDNTLCVEVEAHTHNLYPRHIFVPIRPRTSIIQIEPDDILITSNEECSKSSKNAILSNILEDVSKILNKEFEDLLLAYDKEPVKIPSSK